MSDNTRQHELMKILQEAARAYYDEDREVMPNIEYDALYDELESIEEKTGVVLAGSPTQRVGYSVSDSLEKMEHSSPMLSLSKTKDRDELAAWLGDKEGLLSYKLDGLTVALSYRDGKLASAVTRGNGLVGEVVTNNAGAFSGLPMTIPFKGQLLIRGEAVIRYSDFKRINEEIEDEAAKYKNPRNLASGSVRQLDSSITAKRWVRFYAFALVSAQPIGEAEPHISSSRRTQMEFLEGLGFETAPYMAVTQENLLPAISDFTERLGGAAFDLPVDGLVLAYDDIAYGLSLGRTSKAPRDAIAFKWADEQEETTLLGIEWSASRTGLINPIAVFEPVEIEGSTVSRASVHNISIMEELALGKGDRIKVYKANMIIPQISENLTRSGTETPPAACPVCGADTRINYANDVKTLRCTNEDCPARRLKAFSHFVSRQALNIEGLSDQTLEKFIAAGILHELCDIFKLKNYRQEIVSMEGFGEKSFENLCMAIVAASRPSRERLLYSLGIPEIGVATAKQIVRHFAYDWDKIISASEEDLLAVDSVGSIIANMYTTWFAEVKNIELLSGIMREIDLPDEASPVGAGAGGSKLAGLTFVITGALTGYENREALKKVIEDLGGKTAGSVSKSTDYLVNNDSASTSSKNKKAKELGVKIITEQELSSFLMHR